MLTFVKNINNMRNVDISQEIVNICKNVNVKYILLMLEEMLTFTKNVNINKMLTLTLMLTFLLTK